MGMIGRRHIRCALSSYRMCGLGTPATTTQNPQQEAPRFKAIRVESRPGGRAERTRVSRAALKKVTPTHSVGPAAHEPWPLVGGNG